MPNQFRGYWFCNSCPASFDTLQEAREHEERCAWIPPYLPSVGTDPTPSQQQPSTTTTGVRLRYPLLPDSETTYPSRGMSLAPVGSAAALLLDQIIPADQAALKHLELIETTSPSPVSTISSRVGLRCRGCGEAMPLHELSLPRSIRFLADAIRRLADQHLTQCNHVPHDDRSLLQQARQWRRTHEYDSTSADQQVQRQGLADFCVERCRELGIVNQRPEHSGMVFVTRDLAATTSTTEGMAIQSNRGTRRSSSSTSSSSSSSPSPTTSAARVSPRDSSFPAPVRHLSSEDIRAIAVAANDPNQESSSSAAAIAAAEFQSTPHTTRMERQLPPLQHRRALSSTRDTTLTTATASATTAQPDHSVTTATTSATFEAHPVHDLSSSQALFPFFQYANGEWMCQFCYQLPPNYRDPGHRWSTPTLEPPPPDFIHQHLQLCRSYHHWYEQQQQQQYHFQQQYQTTPSLMYPNYHPSLSDHNLPVPSSPPAAAMTEVASAPGFMDPSYASYYDTLAPEGGDPYPYHPSAITGTSFASRRQPPTSHLLQQQQLLQYQHQYTNPFMTHNPTWEDEHHASSIQPMLTTTTPSSHPMPTPPVSIRAQGRASEEFSGTLLDHQRRRKRSDSSGSASMFTTPAGGPNLEGRMSSSSHYSYHSQHQYPPFAQLQRDEPHHYSESIHPSVEMVKCEVKEGSSSRKRKAMDNESKGSSDVSQLETLDSSAQQAIEYLTEFDQKFKYSRQQAISTTELTTMTPAHQRPLELHHQPPPSLERVTQTELVQAEDKLLLTDFLFYLMKQLQIVQFSETDRKTRGGKREKIQLGFGGMQCIHCANTSKARKFFWSGVDRLANSFAEIPAHTFKCSSCPDEVKSALTDLKRIHAKQMNQLPRGSQKVFFRRVWKRLHDLDPLFDSPRDYGSGSGSDIDTFINLSARIRDIGDASLDEVTPVSKKPPPGVASVNEESPFTIDRSTKDAAKTLMYSSGQPSPSPSSRVLLSITEDRDFLSDLDCFVRRQIEVFCATKNDVNVTEKDGKYPIKEGQVGIRCIHCSLARQDLGASGHAVAYPWSINNIFEAVREFQRLHLASCENLPSSARLKLSTLTESATITSIQRKYYALAARGLGLQDTVDGIRAGAESVPVVSQAVFSFSSNTALSETERSSTLPVYAQTSASTVPFEPEASRRLENEPRSLFDQPPQDHEDPGDGSGIDADPF